MSIDLTLCQFISPFSMIIAGPSSSGKSHFVRNLLKNHKLLVTPKHEKNPKVLWIYGQWQNLYKEPLENVDIEYIEGLPTDSEINDKKPIFIVIDDLMNEVSDDKQLGNLFTKGSHHLNINIIFITQNLFHQGKQMRNIHLSSNYLVLMKNKRDAIKNFQSIE
jgi:septin family protein